MWRWGFYSVGRDTCKDWKRSCPMMAVGTSLHLMQKWFCLCHAVVAWSALAFLKNGPPAVKSVWGEKCVFWSAWGGGCEQGNRGADICACQVISWSRQGTARGPWRWQWESEGRESPRSRKRGRARGGVIVAVTPGRREREGVIYSCEWVRCPQGLLWRVSKGKGATKTGLPHLNKRMETGTEIEPEWL